MKAYQKNDKKREKKYIMTRKNSVTKMHDEKTPNEIRKNAQKMSTKNPQKQKKNTNIDSP